MDPVEGPIADSVDTPEEEHQQQTVSRRKLLKVLSATGGTVAATLLLPASGANRSSKWACCRSTPRQRSHQHLLQHQHLLYTRQPVTRHQVEATSPTFTASLLVPVVSITSRQAWSLSPVQAQSTASQ
jgi:hypothetical protein